MPAKIASNPPAGLDNDAATEKRYPKGIYKGTREEWLEEAMNIMGVWINEFNKEHNLKTRPRFDDPDYLETHNQYMVRMWGYKPSHYKFNAKNIKVSCSLQSGGIKGSKGGSLAHIHYAHATGNSMHEIRMSVELGGRKLKADSNRVADVLLHEMIHSCAVHHGHRRAFKHIAQGVGLTGKMTQTVASEKLEARIKTEIVDVLGKYPHKKVHLTPRGQRGKGSRLIKCECNCGCIIRLTRKWIEQANDPSCEESVPFIYCPIGGESHDLMKVFL